MDVEVSRSGAVLTITLNRPEVLNALNRSMHEGLAGALAQARSDDVRAVVVTGAGRGFCVGQDISDFPDHPAGVGDLLRRHYNRNLLALRALEKPVMAAVNGPAAGAGLALALACDLRIAGRDAGFVPAFLGIGLVPDSGLSHTLTGIIGPAAAFEWILSGRKLTATEALERGIVTEVVEGTELAAVTAERAAVLAAMPTRAIGMTKRLLQQAPLTTLVEQAELEAQLQTAAAATEDFGEGVRAFLEKRPPRFQGR